MSCRVIIIVLDSVGIGELPDAVEYGDIGSDTLGNLALKLNGLNLPNLQNMGIGNIRKLKGIPPVSNPRASYGKMGERSAGKDTITGHWELMGIINPTPFPTYPDGFPDEIIKPFKKAIGKNILGNKSASGTDIINELGKKHIKTGSPIIYTSADSVFQIAAHDNIISIKELCRICKIARSLLVYPHNVARVIARPFTGPLGNFKRTERRKDFSVVPPRPNLLNYIDKTLGIGKIHDIFSGKDINQNIHIKNNLEGIKKIIHAIEEKNKHQMIFANLVDFDTLYGHRNNPQGYYNALREFDDYLPSILQVMNKNDILVLTADHGCDPTVPGTDHTREYVPLLLYGHSIKPGISIGIRSSFSDLAQTLAELWQFPELPNGESFLKDIIS